MCPACIASTAVMVAGAGSTGGILALCIGKFRRFFRANRLGLFRTKENKMQQEEREMKGKGIAMNTPPIVSQQEWEAARQQLLVKEKALTRSRDALAAERRRMPWMAVEKKYEFDGPKGKVSLLDLFEGRRQLIVYRAFFEPGVFGWPEHACRGCSLGADQVAHLAHLNARDTTLAYASRAPQADIARLKARMGWEMPWYTITDSFDADFGVDRMARPQRVLPRRRARCSAHTSSTTAATRRWGPPGATSTSRRSAVRRLGRTRRRVIPRPRRTSGGTGTTTTKPRPRLTRSGSRCHRPQGAAPESATQRRKHDRLHTRRAISAGGNSYHLLDLTVYGRQEKWENSPAGWPQPCTYTRTRPARRLGNQHGRVAAPSPSGLASNPGARTTLAPPCTES